MNKLAYIMHVDWQWVKQRPHFLAEKLAESKLFEIDLFFIRNMKVKRTNNPVMSQLFNSINIVYKIPFSSKYPLLQQTEKRVNSKKLNKIYYGNYDIVWMTSPYLLQFIDIKKIKAKIIYDCMDDVIAFPLSENVKNELSHKERDLLNYSNAVLCSSLQLAEIIRYRGYNGDVEVINNAINLESFRFQLQQQFNQSSLKIKKMIYFGTISNWFNFDTVFSILNYFDDLVIELIGPSEVNIPKHPRIAHIEPLSHDDLIDYANKADAFIMPFELNDLVLSVDPVKVYEYIAYRKPTFIVKYRETEKFTDYVYLYSDESELISYINDFNSGNKKMNYENHHQFIRNNTWNHRVKNIIETLRKL